MLRELKFLQLARRMLLYEQKVRFPDTSWTSKSLERDIQVTDLQAFISVVSAIVLFIYRLQGFSRELQFVGALATAVVRSSSAITSLTTALVDASVISFRSSLGVVLGSNVGTTSTALLASTGMNAAARATEMADFLLKAAGVLLFFPFLRQFSLAMMEFSDDPGTAPFRALELSSFHPRHARRQICAR